jgi:ABC-type multidrug transport system fused ATPase/permease subunit
LSFAARQKYSVGEIVNLQAIDAGRIESNITYLHMIWSAPLQITISIVMLWQVLGPSVLAGLSVMLVLIPINLKLSQVQGGIQKTMLSHKDNRTKLMNEIMQGIRVIRYFAWEPSFIDRVRNVRNDELSTLRTSAYLRAFTGFLWTGTPLLVSLSTFVAFTLAGNQLTAEAAFTSLALFNIIRFPINMLPSVISGLIDSKVSVERLQKYLQGEERVEYVESDPHDVPDDVAIRVDDATFSWDKTGSDSDGSEEVAPEVLKNISFEVKRGQLVAVVGAIGSGSLFFFETPQIFFCGRLLGHPVHHRSALLPFGYAHQYLIFSRVGKSTLLSALLGDIPKKSGRVAVRGHVSYCSQSAFIQNAPVRSCIAFGKPFDSAKYQSIIDCCELRRDLEILPGGDECEIGERGINLSGGQKQRVALARAVYDDGDVYLLDDPLSALDANVGRSIFRNCIHGDVLANKTRILVTHHLQYCRDVDLILVLKDGRIIESGTYSDLVGGNTEFSRLLAKHTVDENHEDEETPADAATAPSTPDIGKGKEKEEPNVKERPENAASKAKLISAEDRETGSVKPSVYFTYMRAIGGLAVAIGVVLSFAVDAFGRMMSDWWLSNWSTAVSEQKIYLQEQFGHSVDPLLGTPIFAPVSLDAPAIAANISASSSYYLGVYAGLGIFNSLVVLARSFFIVWAGLKAAVSLHDAMLVRVMGSPLSFFDTTPTGRILNRFSKDMYAVDENLPRTLTSSLSTLFACLSVIIIIGSVTPWFLVAGLPLAFLYRSVQQHYVANSRELQRLNSISRSPIYAMFSETLAGLSTIRAFARQPQFCSENEGKVDQNQQAYFLTTVANRWLGLRLEFVGTSVVFAASFFAVLERDSIAAGLAGLSITYALQLTSQLNWLVRVRGNRDFICSKSI